MNHEIFMREALKEAEMAFNKDEVPIGCVIVCSNRVIARAHNLTEMLGDPTAHAEMQAITAATAAIGGKYLKNCLLYVTVEPCLMCAGALFWSQISSIIFGAADPKRGFTTAKTNVLHPKTTVESGIMEAECSQLIKVFFQNKRQKKYTL